MTKTKVFPKHKTTETQLRHIKKEKFQTTFATSFSKAKSTFTVIPRSFKFLPSVIRKLINREPQVTIKYQISKLQEFPSFYQVKIFSTFQNARTGKITKQPTQIWEFVKDNESKKIHWHKKNAFRRFYILILSM